MTSQNRPAFVQRGEFAVVHRGAVTIERDHFNIRRRIPELAAAPRVNQQKFLIRQQRGICCRRARDVDVRRREQHYWSSRASSSLRNMTSEPVLTIKLVFDHLRNLTDIQLAKNFTVLSYSLEHRDILEYFQLAPCQ